MTIRCVNYACFPKSGHNYAGIANWRVPIVCIHVHALHMYVYVMCMAVYMDMQVLMQHIAMLYRSII